MDKRIIIIHPSQIIRQGIIALVRTRIDWEIIEFCDGGELSHYRSIRNARIIFVVDVGLANDELTNALSPFGESNSIKILYLTQGENNCTSADNDCHLSLNASKDELLSLLEVHFGTGSNLAQKKSAESMSLTERERDILKLVALGRSNKEMAQLLSISIHTVISHRKNITDKLNIKSISGLTVYAILNRLIDAESIDVESLI
jgi:DNA-binding CsgD family transcriptional regulator